MSLNFEILKIVEDFHLNEFESKEMVNNSLERQFGKSLGQLLRAHEVKWSAFKLEASFFEKKAIKKGLTKNGLLELLQILRNQRSRLLIAFGSFLKRVKYNLADLSEKTKERLVLNEIRIFELLSPRAELVLHENSFLEWIFELLGS